MNVRTLQERILRLKYFNHWAIFFTDLFFSTLATLCALFCVKLALGIGAGSTKEYVTLVVLSIIGSVIGFLTIQTYKGIIRHSSFTDAGRIGIASLIKEVVLILSIILLNDTVDAKYIVLGGMVDIFFTFFSLIFIRVILILSYKYVIQSTQQTRRKDNLLILDPGSDLTTPLASFFQSLEQNYRITGFIRLGVKNTFRLNGYKILSVNDEAELSQLTDRLFIKAVLFPDHQSLQQEANKWVVRCCEKKRIRMLVLPSIDEIRERKINYNNLPEVRIEDLLEREEIQINMQEIADSLKGKVVMITGAAGSIGSELCRQICNFGIKQLVMYDNAETPMHDIQLELSELFPEVELNMVMGDVRSRERFERICKTFLPHVIYHAAAYKHVPMMENNPCESVLTNVLGTQVVADTAVKYGVSKFVMVSTDKAVNPSNVMGASKRIAEMYIQSLGLAVQRGTQAGRTRFITTRFGNVLGSNGSVIPRFRKQLLKGGPITITHPDIIRYFMTIPEACRLVLEASTMGNGNDIFMFDMGTPVKIHDLALRMIQLAGMEPGKDIQIEFTGLRPGEKLYEELLTATESLMPTVNKKIFRASIVERDYITLLPQIRALCELAASVEVTDTVRKMKAIVPEFISQCSIYENLDGEKRSMDEIYIKPELTDYKQNTSDQAVRKKRVIHNAK